MEKHQHLQIIDQKRERTEDVVGGGTGKTSRADSDYCKCVD